MEQEHNQESKVQEEVIPKQPPKPETKKPKKSIMGPLILIVIGVVWLLNTMGIAIDWSLFWPIFIILIGTAMIFGKQQMSGWIVALIIFALLITLAWSVVNGSIGDDFDFHIGDFSIGTAEKIDTTVKNIEVSTEDNPDLTKVNLTAELGVGELSITNTDNDSNVLSSTSSYNYKHLEPFLDQQSVDGTLDLSFSTEEHDLLTWFGAASPKATYDIELHQPTVVTDFDLSVGSGTGDIALTDQLMTDFDLTVGSGEATTAFAGANTEEARGTFTLGSGQLDITGLANANFTSLGGTFGSGNVDLGFDGTPASTTMTVDVEGGSGNLDVLVPEAVGFKIISDVGSGRVRVDSDTLDEDETYTSDNFDEAAFTIEFDLTLGSGNITFKTS